MSTMIEEKVMNRTVVFTGPKEVELQESAVPEAGRGQVLVKTTASMISTGTELTILSGEFPANSAWSDYARYPFKAGYSNVGEVVGVGEASDYSLIGKKVATGAPHCAYYTAAAESVMVLPDGIPDDQASFHSLAKIAMNGVRRSRIDWGESVVIYGMGLLGQLAARFCALAGARPVICVDVSDTRLGMVPDLPYVHTLNAARCDVEKEVKNITRGRMADIVFEVTGAQHLIPGEFKALKRQGRFVMLSSPRGETSFDFHDLCNSPSFEIIGAHVCSHPEVETPYNPWTVRRNVELFFDHIAHGDINAADMISHRLQPAEAPGFYRRLLQDRSDVMGVVIGWE